MSLADKFVSPPPTIRSGSPCSVRVLLDTLEGDELKALTSMLASREWTQVMIWQALTDEGYSVGQQSINRHRGNKCRCAKDRA